MATEQRGKRKVRVGVVVSDKMQKTVVVEVETRTRHPLYGKTIRKTRRFKAHDEENQCRVGDVVRIMETRPLSKEKRWRVVEILERRTVVPEEKVVEE
jgi:small subunit ribosomal protein S17